jgi:glycosyltransferase involved in cell wall biosynthesis
MLLEQNPEIRAKLQLLHNWVDIDHHSADEVHSERTPTDFRKKWNITHQHIAVFAGVMGPSQYLELILGVAERMQDQTDLLFLLVGDGKEKEKLQQIAKERDLKNVQFEGFISRDVYPDLLNICSIGLVCLSPQNKTPVVPGKILGFMAVGLPVAAFLHSASDGHELINESGCGISANSADISSSEQALRLLMQNTKKFSAIGESGKHYAVKHFSKEICVSQLEKMLKT